MGKGDDLKVIGLTKLCAHRVAICETHTDMAGRLEPLDAAIGKVVDVLSQNISRQSPGQNPDLTDRARLRKFNLEPGARRLPIRFP